MNCGFVQNSVLIPTVLVRKYAVESVWYVYCVHSKQMKHFIYALDLLFPMWQTKTNDFDTVNSAVT